MHRRGKGAVACAIACAATGIVGVAPAQAALLSGITSKLTTTVTSVTTTVSSTTTAVTSATAPVTSAANSALSQVTSVAAPVTDPVVNSTTTAATRAAGDVQPTSSALGGAVAQLTTDTSNAVQSVVGGVLPPQPTQMLNVIPAGYDPITPIQQLIGGTAGLGNVLQGLACKPLSEVKELVAATGLDPITSGLTSLACNAAILDYRFFTRYTAADGSTITRTHVAQLGVPTPLDVDEDAVPDLIGTLTFTGLNAVGLTIDRAAGELATLPVAVEGVVSDTGGGLLGRRQLAVGYDARMDRAPGRFVLSTPLDTILDPSPTVTASLTQTGRGEKIALLAGAFDGAPGARQNPAELRLDYGRSPDNATITARIDSAVSVTTTTDRPGPAQLSGRIVEGARETVFDADLQDLPSRLSLDATTEGRLSATYAASARMDRLVARFVQRTRDGDAVTVDQKAILDLTDVPTGLHVEQNGQGGSFETTGGPLGRATVGVANGEPRFLPDAAYVNLEQDGGVRSLAAQIPGLERATFDVGDAPSLSATLQATPLRVRLVEPARRIEARVDRLPHQLDLRLNLADGVLDYDGHGDGIDEITLAAHQATPFVGRADHIRGTIAGIPARMTATLTAGAQGGGVEVTGSGPLQRVELAASNGGEELPPGTGQGAIYRDVPGGEYLLSARILDLRKIAFGTRDGLSLQAVTKGGPFTLSARTATLEAQGEVADLPADTTLALDSAQDELTFTGRDGDGDPVGIDRISLAARSLDGALFGDADHVDAQITDIPSPLTVGFRRAGDGLDVTASKAIGRIELVAANRAIDRDADLPAGTHQALRYVDDGARFLASARILGFRRIAAQLGGTLSVTAETAGGPFDVEARTATLTAEAHVRDLPAKTTITGALADGRFAFRGRDGDDHDAPVGTVDLAVASTSALFARATYVAGHIAGIPADLTVDFAQNGDGVGVDADNPIGLIEIAAANRAIDTATDLPAAGDQGVRYTDRSGGDFAIGARVRRLKTARVSTGTPIKVRTETEGGPFTVALDTDALTADARIEDLPERLSASLDLGEGKLVVDNSSALRRVLVDAHSAQPLFGRARYVHADVRDIPAAFTVDFAQNGDGVGVSTDDPIGSIEVAAGNHAFDPATDLPALDEQGVVYTDHAGGRYAIGARVRELKIARVSTGTPIKLRTETQGGPFTLSVDTDDLVADGRLEDLPRTLQATLDLSAGRLAVSNSSALDRIFLNAHSTSPLFGRARFVHADIRDIPAAFTVDFAENGDGVGVSTDDAIGSIEVAAANHPIDLTADLPAGDEQGVRYADLTGGAYAIGARVRELRKARLTTTAPLRLAIETAGGPFSADVRTDDLTADARIEDLPAKLSGVIDLDNGTFRLDGKNRDGDDTGIGRVLVDAHGTQPLFGRATDVRADIKDIPANLVLQLAQGDEGLNLDASDPIGSIEVAAKNGPIASLAGELPADDEQGATFTDVTGGDFLVAARVRKLKHLGADVADTVTLSAQTEGGPFTLHAKTDDVTGDAVIRDLPAKLQAEIDLDAGKLSVNGRNADDELQRIDRIDVALHSTTPVFGRATDLVARIDGIPGDMLLDIAQDAAGVRLDAHDNPIDLLQVAAADHPVTLADALPGTGQRATYHDTPGEFLLAARVDDLKLVNVSLSDDVDLTARTAGGPFDIDVDTADLDATGSLHDLPDEVQIGLHAADGELTYHGSGPIDELRLAVRGTQPFFANARRLAVEVDGLAPDVTLGLAQNGSGGAITTSALIDRVQLVASSDPTPQPFPSEIPDGEQGAVYHDTNSDFLLAARLLDLRSLQFALAGNDVHLTSELRRTPFTVDLDAADIAATAKIDQLPAKTELALDLQDGHFRFSGKASDDTPVGIDAITFGADAPASAPLFGAATKLRGRIIGVPPTIDVGFDQDSGAADISTAGGAIQELSFLASDDPDADFRAAQGITFRDRTPAAGDRDFDLSAKVLGLSHLTAGIQGLGGDDPSTPQEETGSILLDAKTAGGLFDLDIASDAFSASGVIDELPADARIEADLGNGEVSFDGSAGISRLQLTAQGAEPIFGRADNLDVDVRDLPQSVTLGIKQADANDPSGSTGASIDAKDADGNPVTISKVEIAAWNDHKELPADDHQGVVYRDVDTDGDPDNGIDGPFRIGARINGLQSLTANFGEALTLDTKIAGGVFDAAIQTGALDADVTVDALPSAFKLYANLGDSPVETAPGTALDPGTVGYTGNAPIGRLFAAVRSEEPLISNANRFEIDLKQLPNAATIGVAPDSGKLTLSAGGAEIGQVDIRAADAGSTFPDVPGDPTDDGAFLDGTDGKFRLAARVYKLQLVEVTLDPIQLHAKVGVSKPFHADIKLPPAEDAAPGTDPIHAVLDVLNLPSELQVGIEDLPSTVADPANPGQFLSGGAKLNFQGTSNVSQLKISADGLELLPGADGVAADIRGVPSAFSLELPDQEVLTGQPLAKLAVTPGQQINELRLAAGGVHLTDAGMTTGSATDQFIYHGNPAGFGVGVKLTGVKGLTMNLDPVNLVIDQNPLTTKPVAIDAKLPQETGPDSEITGSLNKPTGHTEVGVTLIPGTPTRLNLQNGSSLVGVGNAANTMGSLSLSLKNLGTIPSASFSLSNVPHKLQACLNVDGSCIRTDANHATSQFGTWQPSSSCTPKPQVPGNFPTGMSPPGYRPYNPQVSMYFDDLGTSVQAGGPNSAANRSTANMVTMNADIALDATSPHVQITNLRFHSLSLDFADSGTSFTFKPIVSISAGSVPRIYIYLDSQKLPFVMNEVKYPPQIPKMVMGTDGNPARAWRRISWIPGARTGSLCGLGQSIDTQSQNSLDCGGAKELQMQTSLGTLNAFNLPLFGDVLNICGGTVPTT